MKAQNDVHAMKQGRGGVGLVPAHWRDRRLDGEVESYRKLLDTDGLAGRQLFHYSIPNVQHFGDGQYESGDDLDSAKLLVQGERVLVSKLNPRKGTVCIAYPRDVLTVASPELVQLAMRAGSLKYLYYLMLSDAVLQRLSALVQSVTKSHQRVQPSDILHSWWSIPPAAEQKQIADFLDRETARIDTLIEKQRQLIETLRERRMAVVDDAIRPLSWKAVQLRYLSASPIEAGVDEQSNSANPADWTRYIRTTDIASLTTLDDEKRVTVPEESAILAPVIRDDIVATRAGATVGKTYIHRSDERACYAGYLVRIRPAADFVCPMFMAHWTTSRHFADQIQTGMVKSTIENYSAARYRSTVMPLPSLPEQERTTDHLDEQTTKIDVLIEKAERFIELSKERRSALITAAVTGQIDVTGEGDSHAVATNGFTVTPTGVPATTIQGSSHDIA